MIDVPFQKSTNCFGDWIIAAPDRPGLRQMFLAMGADRRLRDGHAIYSWGLPLDDAAVLNGYGIQNGTLVLGPRAVSLPIETGNYELIDTAGATTKISADVFGSRPIYYGDRLVTNRLHLAALIDATPNLDALRSTVFSLNAFSQQANTIASPISGVELLCAHETIEVTGSSIRIRATDQTGQFEPLTPDGYHELIEQGAEEIKANLRAVVDTGLRITAAITGGRDSRVVFAGLLAIGAIDAVGFRTQDVGDDIAIGTGLVARYGGHYGAPSPDQPNYITRSPRDAVSWRRSHRFGSYHLARPIDFNTIFNDAGPKSILIGGGFGELFRSFYNANTAAPDMPATLRDLSRHLIGNSPEHGRRVLPLLEDTMNRLPGTTTQHKLDAHYLNFRSRFHFGQPSSMRPGSDLAFSPLAAPSLLRAARGLPNAERQSARVLFDVTRALSEDLAYTVYDKPWAADLLTGPYHKPHRLDGQEISIEPRPELAKAPPMQHRRPPSEKFDALSFVKESIRRRLKWIQTTELRGIVPIVRGHVTWSINQNKPALWTWYSRLDAFRLFLG